MKFNIKLIFIMIFIVVINLTAHEHKNHEQNSTIEDTTVMSHSNIVTTIEKPKVEEPFKLNYLEETLSHVHNKLVHFPVALSFLAFLFTLLSFKWKQFEFSIKYIVLTAAIFSIPTVITGLNQAEYFIGDPKEWIVGIHKTLGIILLSTLWIWFIFLSIKPLKRFGWIIATISLVVMIITGFYGGILAG